MECSQRQERGMSEAQGQHPISPFTDPCWSTSNNKNIGRHGSTHSQHSGSRDADLSEFENTLVYTASSGSCQEKIK